MNDKPESVCITSPHEEGFWQADVYLDGWYEGAAPDGFCTSKLGGSRSEVISKVRVHHPSITIIEGVTGICSECAQEHFNLELVCDDCGSEVRQE